MSENGDKSAVVKGVPNSEGTRFKPGQSGNPGGRPRRRPITERYAAMAEEPLEESLRLELKMPKGSTYGDAMALGQGRAAIKGNTSAAREIREAIEGKATQRIEFTDTTRAEAFDKMTDAELEAYAKDGTLPDWFPRSEDGPNGA
jgi:hypothetical protein